MERFSISTSIAIIVKMIWRHFKLNSTCTVIFSQIERSWLWSQSSVQCDWSISSFLPFSHRFFDAHDNLLTRTRLVFSFSNMFLRTVFESRNMGVHLLFLLVLVSFINGLDVVDRGSRCKQKPNCCPVNWVCATKVSCPYWKVIVNNLFNQHKIGLKIGTRRE